MKWNPSLGAVSIECHSFILAPPVQSSNETDEFLSYAYHSASISLQTRRRSIYRPYPDTTRESMRGFLSHPSALSLYPATHSFVSPSILIIPRSMRRCQEREYA